MTPSLIITGVVAAFVGFGGTLAVVLSAAQAVSATPEQTVSWVVALCLAMMVTSALLSWRLRVPIVTAWSTPGAALIAGTSGISIEAAVGAFVVAAALIAATAAISPLGRLIQRIPSSIASAMLAGVLLRFVLAVFETAQFSPGFVLPLVAAFLLVRLIYPPGAVLAVLALGIAAVLLRGDMAPIAWGATVEESGPLGGVWITPVFDPAVLIGLAVPLYIVTMASQNLPGFAVLKASGYPVPTRPILAVTGLASLITAPFGAHTSNLSAIIASMCTGPDAHPDPAKRWLTGPVYGASYAMLAIFGASVVAIFTALPKALIVTVAGLGLLAPVVAALSGALADERQRFAAVLTLTVTASNLSLMGIGSAFWGLCAGLLALGLEDGRRRYFGG
jgi:benzoate membrane transport protein